MAKNVGVNFNGKRIVSPGVHSRIDASGLGFSGSISDKKLILVGSAAGGKPSTYLEFSNSYDAKKVLRGGDLLEAGELAWNPSGDGLNAGTIGFIRVDSATQSTLTKNALKFTSKLYGEEANQIQVKLEDGTLAGSKRLTVFFWKDNTIETFDNLGPVFNIKYTGEESTATVTITKDASDKASSISLKAGSVTVATFTLGTGGQFSEVNKLISTINELPGFSATTTAAGGKYLPTTVLDAVADQDVKTTFTVTALKGDIESQLQFSSLVDLEILPSANMPSNFTYAYLAGGSNGTVPATWTTYLDLIAGEGAYLIVPLTSDEAIHAEVQSFVGRQTNIENNEMRAFYGGAIGETIERVLNRAVSLNSSHASIVHPGAVSPTTGKLLAPYFTAAMVAGRIAGVPVGEPVTNDYLSLPGVEKVLTTDEINRLLEGGVTPIQYVHNRTRNGFRIAQCITTYQEDNNPVYRENSVGEIADFLNSDLREHLESRFIGTKGTTVTPALIKNEVQSFLDQKVRDAWLAEYDPESVVVLDGETIQVSYSAMPVNSVNYVVITGSFYRASITA